MSSIPKQVVSSVSQTIRKRRSSLALDKVPTMAEFIHKRTVLHQYRHFLKATKSKLPPADRSSAVMEIQTRFRQLQTDALSIQMAVKEGERQLMQLQSLVGYDYENNTPPTTTTTTTTNSSHNQTAAFMDQDSWINTPDPEDPRGRVGDMWPWQSSSKPTR
jgi:Complex 1 protein (LYR family)